MTKKELARQAVAALKEEYPGAVCSLEYQDPLQLLIAVRLSAQCTDARVNLVTPGLFARFPTLEAFCEGTEEEIGELIRSCGFYNTKSKDILGMCKMIRDEFGGQVPDTMEELTRLPGVGRKTANLIVGDVYGKPAVVTDTHCIRIAGRLGLTDNTAPEKVENDLRAVLAPGGIQRFLPPAGAPRPGGVHRPEGLLREMLHGGLLQEGSGPQRGKAALWETGREKTEMTPFQGTPRFDLPPSPLDLNLDLSSILERKNLYEILKNRKELLSHGKIQSVLYKPAHLLWAQPAAKAGKAHHRGGHRQH